MAIVPSRSRPLARYFGSIFYLTPSGHAWQSVVMKPAIQSTLETAGAIERANHLILEFLKVGPRSATEILAAAEGAKISVRTVQRAAIDFGVVKSKAGFAGGWTWALPVDGDLESYKASTRVGEGQGAENTKVSLRVEAENDKVSIRGERANVIAARLRKLETARGMKGPFYPQDSRVQAWAQAGLSDPDLKEAYDRATTDHHGMLTAGILDRYISEVMKEAAR